MHTPGPWKLIGLPIPNLNKSEWRILDSEDKPIAQSDVGPHAFNLDNGRLIASAPRLLEALEDVLGRIDFLHEWAVKGEMHPGSSVAIAEAVGKYRIAIAEAKGK